MPSRMKRAARRARTDELAEQVGLTDRLGYYPRQLSGGQIQRVAIARALFNKPPILLADEPTGNLDSQNSQSIIALFRDVCRTFGTTVVVVTHSREIATMADRVVMVKDGAVV